MICREAVVLDVEAVAFGLPRDAGTSIGVTVQQTAIEASSGQTWQHPVPAIATIGVYGFSGATFLDRLKEADISLSLDVRQRRGVRGPDYAWANSLRLQAALAEAKIGYQHHRELAPTTELRQLQYAEDHRQGVGKRTRRELAANYTRRYTREILDCADLAPVVSGLPSTGRAALLCVERDAEACHRSLVAGRLAERFGVAVEHLGPR